MAGGEESGREPKGGHRGVLGLQTGQWAPGLAGMGLLSGSRERSLLIPVSLWHQPHLITMSPRIKISGVCCLEETNPRSLFKTSAPTLVLLSALLSPLLSQEAEESVRWGVGIAACEPEQGQVQLPRGEAHLAFRSWRHLVGLGRCVHNPELGMQALRRCQLGAGRAGSQGHAL